MAVKVFCSDVIGAFTHCDPVAAIYTYGEQVWPNGPVPFGTWYVSWLPTDLSGGFNMFGPTSRLEDYDGLYSWTGSSSGYIKSYAFDHTNMTYMETNVKTIDSAAFSRCSLMEIASMPRVKSISFAAFHGCSSLSMVYAPNVRRIDHAAFRYCKSLKSIDFPKCEYIELEAFIGGHSLSTANLPKCSHIEGDAFAGCRLLNYISLPVCEFVDNEAFYGCSSLESISLPLCSYIGGEVFMGCSLLSDVYVPLCELIGWSAFYNCSLLSQISLPNCKVIYGQAFENTTLRSIVLPNYESELGEAAFRGCSYLSYVDLGNCNRIWSYAFMNTNLTELCLWSNSVVRKDASVFDNTPLANCAGSIYVPFGMYGYYKRSTVWNSVFCNFVSVFPEPGSYYINWTQFSFTWDPFFTIDGFSYYYNDFSGSFLWFDGNLTTGYSDGRPFCQEFLGSVETNAYSIDSWFFTCGINEISAPNCEYVGLAAFKQTAIRSAYLPVCRHLGHDAFAGCSRLSSVVLPVCESIGSNTFWKCIFESINLPSCSYIGEYAFTNCTSLISVNLPVCEYICRWAFNSCTLLNKIQIEYSSVCTLQSSTAFYSTGITSSTGSILVPSSLVSVYKTASGWRSFSNRIFPIPE